MFQKNDDYTNLALLLQHFKGNQRLKSQIQELLSHHLLKFIKSVKQSFLLSVRSTANLVDPTLAQPRTGLQKCSEDLDSLLRLRRLDTWVSVADSKEISDLSSFVQSELHGFMKDVENRIEKLIANWKFFDAHTMLESIGHLRLESHLLREHNIPMPVDDLMAKLAETLDTVVSQYSSLEIKQYPSDPPEYVFTCLTSLSREPVELFERAKLQISQRIFANFHISIEEASRSRDPISRRLLLQQLHVALEHIPAELQQRLKPFLLVLQRDINPSE
jgi:hypothetical protein